jgi:hypothetical protein
MKPPRFELIRVQRLHRQLEDRVFAVPKVQREFVWNGTRAAALLDSIYRGMPIGSILVWETGRANCDLLRPSLNVLPHYDSSNENIRYIIDGQQRLSVLYQAFTGDRKENSNGRSIDFSRLCFRIDGKNGEDAPAWFTYRKPIVGQYISIADLLGHGWRRRLRMLNNAQFRRVEQCRERVMNYRVPVIVVESADLDEVRETFIRVNTQGMRISAADRAFARASEIDLRDKAHDLRAALPGSFRELPYTSVLLGFTFIDPDRESDVGAKALERAVTRWERHIDGDPAARNQLLHQWGRYRTAFTKALDYLRANFSVLDIGFLPSTNMVATLAVFFYHHKAAPSSKRRSEICKWFWATGVGQRYSGRGYRQNILRDVEFFEKLVRTERTRFRFENLASPSDVQRTEYTQPAALARAFMCLLACQSPRYLNNGEPVPLEAAAARANRRDQHHVFPKALLNANRFFHRDYNSLCNICLVVAEENQVIGAKSPRTYLAPFRRKQFFARAMKSHLLPHTAESALWFRGVKRAFRQFRKQRLRLICKALEEEAGIRLFRPE